MNITALLTEEFGLLTKYVEHIIALIDEGNTIPFIARYRKELTGNVDDQVLRALADRLAYLRNLEKRREEILRSIEEQDKLTDALRDAIDRAETLTALEDLYRPYRAGLLRLRSSSSRSSWMMQRLRAPPRTMSMQKRAWKMRPPRFPAQAISLPSSSQTMLPFALPRVKNCAAAQS